jgi:hypothetical protein
MKALRALRTGRHKEWRGRRFVPPEVVLYGTQKFTKAKLAIPTIVLDNSEPWLYHSCVARLPRVPALCIVDPKPERCGGQRLAAHPAVCLQAGWARLRSGPPILVLAIQVAKLAKLSEFRPLQPIGGESRERHYGTKRGKGLKTVPETVMLAQATWPRPAAREREEGRPRCLEICDHEKTAGPELFARHA